MLVTALTNVDSAPGSAGADAALALAIFAAAHLFDAAVWAATIVSGAAPRVQRWLLLVLWGMRLLLAPLMRMPLPVRQQEEMGDCQFWVKS